ncbi:MULTISPECIES: NAD(P)/FAD-dependent oxidoreductase [unclassified Sphingomonas]|uniref:NAD(P)/FAD-dependent oxidoreductase n=1 Tax=unclassified Sphingomonas TaxID=196159 RepID=UPI0006F4817A|nr:MULTISPECIES: NAD(P)/FAD-dependent oxidoreductase [unclassified Sphingomonas]KQM28409.1 thioredoxin reductase [Sphingomonas sp. Leaf9]KQM45115.1 thioredoxin reductase [Sphingomonas sp. Leaf11]
MPAPSPEPATVDCAIIGAGPAGLTAAIYLARFHLTIRLFDCGSSRAAMIPRTHNHAGYPGGIPGTELLARMHDQAREFGATCEAATVTAIERDGDDFIVRTDHSVLRARTVLLATGVVNHRPAGLNDAVHDDALRRGLLRYCPICDGYEVTDRRVGVIGTGDHGMREALFLRGYTADVTLIAPDSDHALDDECWAALDAGGIRRVDGPCGDYRIDGEHFVVRTAEGELSFDSVYPALGSHIRSELAIAAGARASEDGCLEVDDHQRTSIPGLFAAGDVVKGLDQISHAMGEAGVAATTIRNTLAERRPIRR